MDLDLSSEFNLSRHFDGIDKASSCSAHRIAVHVAAELRPQWSWGILLQTKSWIFYSSCLQISRDAWDKVKTEAPLYACEQPTERRLLDGPAGREQRWAGIATAVYDFQRSSSESASDPVIIGTVLQVQLQSLTCIRCRPLPMLSSRTVDMVQQG